MRTKIKKDRKYRAAVVLGAVLALAAAALFYHFHPAFPFHVRYMSSPDFTARAAAQEERAERCFSFVLRKRSAIILCLLYCFRLSASILSRGWRTGLLQAEITLIKRSVSDCL